MCDFYSFCLIFPGQMHCLPQRLKSTFLKKNSNRATHTLFIVLFFALLAHCVLPQTYMYTICHHTVLKKTGKKYHSGRYAVMIFPQKAKIKEFLQLVDFKTFEGYHTTIHIFCYTIFPFLSRCAKCRNRIRYKEKTPKVHTPLATSNRSIEYLWFPPQDSTVEVFLSRKTLARHLTIRL